MHYKYLMKFLLQMGNIWQNLVKTLKFSKQSELEKVKLFNQQTLWKQMGSMKSFENLTVFRNAGILIYL